MVARYRCLLGCSSILTQSALMRDYYGKCIEWIEGHYLEVVVVVYHLTNGHELFCLLRPCVIFLR